jgi:hypothetical protein
MKGRTGYAVMTGAIALLLLVVIYLAWNLFQFEAPRLTPTDRPTPPRRLGTTVETDVTIDVGEESGDGVMQIALTATNPVPQKSASLTRIGGGATGKIPAVCIHYGPSITGSEAFSGPVTHDAIIRRDGITFQLNSRPDDAAGGAE